MNNKITLLLSYYRGSTKRKILPILLGWEMEQRFEPQTSFCMNLEVTMEQEHKPGPG